MIKKYFIVLFVVITGSLMLNLPAESATKRYADAQGRFSFEFEGTWLTSDVSAYPNVISRYQVTGERSGEPLVVGEVVITKLSMPAGVSFDQYIKQEQQQVQATASITASTQHLCVVDNHKGVRTQLAFTSAKDQRIAAQYYVEADDAIWGISIITTPDQQQLLRQIEQTMIPSFKFSVPPRSEPKPQLPQPQAIPATSTTPVEPVPTVPETPQPVATPDTPAASPAVTAPVVTAPVVTAPVVTALDTMAVAVKDEPDTEPALEPTPTAEPEQPQLMWSPKRGNR